MASHTDDHDADCNSIQRQMIGLGVLPHPVASSVGAGPVKQSAISQSGTSHSAFQPRISYDTQSQMLDHQNTTFSENQNGNSANSNTSQSQPESLGESQSQVSYQNHEQQMHSSANLLQQLGQATNPQLHDPTMTHLPSQNFSTIDTKNNDSGIPNRLRGNIQHHGHVPPNNHSPHNANRPSFLNPQAFHHGDYEYEYQQSLNNRNLMHLKHPQHGQYRQPLGLASTAIKNTPTSHANELINGSHAASILSSLGAVSSVSTATAVENIASIINASTSSDHLNAGNNNMSSLRSPAQRSAFTGHAFVPSINSGHQFSSGHTYFNDQSNKEPNTHSHALHNGLPNSRNNVIRSQHNPLVSIVFSATL